MKEQSHPKIQARFELHMPKNPIDQFFESIDQFELLSNIGEEFAAPFSKGENPNYRVLNTRQWSYS